MALIDRLRGRVSEPVTPVTDEPEADKRAQEQEAAKRDTEYQELKSRIHNRLFDHIDLTRFAQVSENRVAQDIAELTHRILQDEEALLTADERQRVISEVQHEVFGLGPLEPLLQDPRVNDILVNGHAQIYVERSGKIEPTVARFRDDAHLMRIIEKILTQVGRRVDESTPLVDARLEDGSRVNVIIPPLALDGPMLSIRRFQEDKLTAEALVEIGSLTPEAMKVLEGIVKGRLNVLIAGGTGAGKTTLLNVLSGFIPVNERIVTIEDSAELQLRQTHVVRLETRPANVEGRGRVTQRELVINALRMRPDRIVVGEVRGSEALDMLQAMNTGHDGSLTTIHSNSPRDALMRLETMVAMTGFELPLRAVRSQIASAVDLVIQIARLSDGTRCITSIQEITGSEGDVVMMQEIFQLQRNGVANDGTVLRRLVPVGIRPRFCERLAHDGIEFGGELFDPENVRADMRPESAA
ncbi:MAG: pilus assembly protein CpaF [Deltaproteobacteria bacterium]|jgi:pilus assembly protein CpaF|nr:pilus assembly protein CpaF [Deltaproteobacteria bacterium]